MDSKVYSDSAVSTVPQNISSAVNPKPWIFYFLGCLSTINTVQNWSFGLFELSRKEAGNGRPYVKSRSLESKQDLLKKLFSEKKTEVKNLVRLSL